MSEMVQKILL